MIRTTILGLALVLGCVAMAKTIEKIHYVHFEKDSYEISQDEQEKLLAFLNLCDHHLAHRFLLEGHTDSDGSDEYNIALSQNRVNQVSEFFVTKGVARALIDDGYYGESDPIASNDQVQGMAKNRRVLIRYVGEHFQDVGELHQSIQEEYTSTISLDGTEQLVVTENGVKIQVPENAFVNSRGENVDDVQLVVKEAMVPTAMAANLLGTRTKSGLLITGGMIKVTAYGPDGEELELAEGVNLPTAIPDDGRMEEMQLFRTDDEGSTWELSEEEEMLSNEVDWSKAPKRPQIKLPNYNPPEFIEPKRPVKPSNLHEPKEPKEPQLEDYVSEATFWNVLSRNKQRKKDAKRWGTVMQNYNRKYDRYLQRQMKYERMITIHPELLAEYEQELLDWEEEKKRAWKEHKDVVLPQAYKEYQASIAPLQAAYKVRYEAWKEEYNAWAEQFESAYADLEITTEAEDSYYVFESSNMGWVNCDRFWDVPEASMQDIVADAGESLNSKDDAMAVVILSDGRSMIPMIKENNLFSLSGFPKGEMGELVAYTVKDGRIYLYTEVFEGKKEFDIEFEPASMAELKRLLGESFELSSL